MSDLPQTSHVYMPIFSYSHSTTCWQQEVSCFKLSQTPPRFNDINIMFGQSNVKAFAMLNCEDLECSVTGVFVAHVLILRS